MDKLEIKATLSVDDAGTITGIAWPFGAPDSVGDLIEKGAFSAAPAMPILYEHDADKVIGTWQTIDETDAGLQVKGRLFLESVPLARDVHALIKRGKANGLSIGFRATETKTREDGNRTILALDLAEISIVANPCHPDARILTVKSAGGAASRSPERTSMDPELKNEPEVKSDPVVDPKDMAALKARLDKLEAKANRPAAANGSHPAADNDNLETKAFADFLRGAEFDRKALTVANDAPSYILAPEERSGEFIRNLVEFSPVRAIADVRTTGSHTILLPKRLAVTNAKWKGEAVASEASEPTFDQMEIGIKEVTTHVDIGNWLIEDATHDVEAEVRLALAEDFAAKEGLAFVHGSAALEPKGFMADSAIASFDNGHVAAIDPDALISMMYALPAVYRNRGTWTMNGTTLAAVRKLKDGQGNYLWQPSYQAGQPETILGRPVVELIDMADIGEDAEPIAFGDFKAGYRIYDRIELAVRPNPYLLATEGLVRFHARRRVGAGVVRPEALRKLKMAA